MASKRQYTCTDCGLDHSSSRIYIKHRKICHNEEEFIKCPICISNLVRARRFSQHLLDAHDGVTFQPSDCPSTMSQNDMFGVNIGVMVSNHDEGKKISTQQHNFEETCDEEEVLEVNALEPRSCVEKPSVAMVNHNKSFFDHMTREEILQESFRKIIMKKEQLLITDKQLVTIIRTMKEMFDMIKNHGRGEGLENLLYNSISSTKMIDRYIRKNFNTIKAQTQYLSGKKVLRFKIGDIVKKELGDKETYNQILDGNKYRHQEGEPIKSFRDTVSFKDNMARLKLMEKEEYREKIIYVFIELFLDDFSCFESLGAASDRGKFLGVYLNLLDVPIKYRLKRSKQKLVTLIPRSEMVDHKIRSCLDPMIKELLVLGSKPTDILKNGRKIPIKIILAKITGDSLGMFELLGLCRNWKGRICRICKATKTQIQQDPATIGAGLRTNEFWDTEVQKLSLCATEELKCIPAFYDLSRFMSFNSMYTSDRMHNLILGIYPDFLAGSLPSILSDDVSDTLSDTMRSMKLKAGFATFKKTSGDGRNSYKFKGQADSLYAFFLNLPEIIIRTLKSIHGHGYKEEFDSIAKSSEYKAYLKLRIIDWFICKDSFSKQELQRLEELIMDFIVKRHDLNMDQTVIPKLHFLTHVTHDIETSGPLILYDTIRYERRHQSFKQKARTTRNSRCLSYSFATWDARIMAISSENANEFHFDGKTAVDYEEGRNLTNMYNFLPDYQVRSLTAQELTIERGEVYLIQDQFVRIKMMVKAQNEFFRIIVEILSHTSFDRNLLCYVLKHDDPAMKCYEIFEFFGHHPYRWFEFENILLLNKNQFNQIVA